MKRPLSASDRISKGLRRRSTIRVRPEVSLPVSPLSSSETFRGLSVWVSLGIMSSTEGTAFLFQISAQESNGKRLLRHIQATRGTVTALSRVRSMKSAKENEDPPLRWLDFCDVPVRLAPMLIQSTALLIVSPYGALDLPTR